jgi:hypothetical protein
VAPWTAALAPAPPSPRCSPTSTALYPRWHTAR